MGATDTFALDEIDVGVAIAGAKREQSSGVGTDAERRSTAHQIETERTLTLIHQ